jgi:hypothetical protein
MPPGITTQCDNTGTLNLQNDTDVDYYALQAESQSVNVQLYFDPDRPSIDLSLDGVRATESSLSDDGTAKTLEITGCGEPVSLVKVSGEKGYYDMCLSLVTLQDNCIGINDADRDGIADEVDTEPKDYSDGFSDGITSGIINYRGDQSLMIWDSPHSSKGVVIKAAIISSDEDAGFDKAVVSACDNAATYYLDSGDEETVTCGSVVTRVSSGRVTVKFTGDNGLSAVADLPAGNVLVFDDELFSLSASQDNVEPIVLGFEGVIEEVNPGEVVGVECINDTAPPVVNVWVTPDILWPPNHKMVPVAATVTASDACDSRPAVELESVTVSEDDATNTYDSAYDGTVGDGNTTDDIQNAEVGTDDLNIALRAERSGSGTGRVYTITYEATDAAGNTGSGSATVTVPRNH